MAEDKSRIPEWMFTTPVGTVDREAEEVAIKEEELAKQKAEEAEKTRPPSFDTPGAPPPVDPETGQPVELLPGRHKGSMMPGTNPPRQHVPTKGALVED